MVSKILGTEIWGRCEPPAGSRDGVPENISKIQVLAINNKCIFC